MSAIDDRSHAIDTVLCPLRHLLSQKLLRWSERKHPCLIIIQTQLFRDSFFFDQCLECLSAPRDCREKMAQTTTCSTSTGNLQLHSTVRNILYIWIRYRYIYIYDWLIICFWIGKMHFVYTLAEKANGVGVPKCTSTKYLLHFRVVVIKVITWCIRTLATPFPFLQEFSRQILSSAGRHWFGRVNPLLDQLIIRQFLIHPFLQQIHVLLGDLCRFVLNCIIPPRATHC